jgi:hypothetical protein
MAHSSFINKKHMGDDMFYDQAEAIIINKRGNEFRNDATIFNDQIAGDDALNAALMRFYCSGGFGLGEEEDLAKELNRIETNYATKDIGEEVGILLTEEGGKRDEFGEWL